MGKSKKERKRDRVAASVHEAVHATEHEAAKLRKKAERAARKAFKKERHKRDNKRWSRDFADFSEQLAVIGLRINDVPGDGNCMFRAVSDQLYGTVHRHEEIRAQVCDHIGENREQYEPFVEDDEPFDEYLEDMRQDGTWGGHIELQAISIVCNVNLVIHQLHEPRWEINSWEPGTKTIHLSYHQGQHFASVRPIRDDGVGPAKHSAKTIERADAASGVARRREHASNNDRSSAGDGDFARSRQEEMVLDATGLTEKDLDRVREVLAEHYYDVDAASAQLLAEREVASAVQHGELSEQEQVAAAMALSAAESHDTAPLQPAQPPPQRVMHPEPRRANEQAKLSNRQRKEQARRERQAARDAKLYGTPAPGPSVPAAPEPGSVLRGDEPVNDLNLGSLSI